MVFVERNFPVFVRNVVFCGENVLVLGEKWYSGEQLSYFGEKESCCFVGATSRFGEKMVCGGENISYVERSSARGRKKSNFGVKMGLWGGDNV